MIKLTPKSIVCIIFFVINVGIFLLNLACTGIDFSPLDSVLKHPTVLLILGFLFTSVAGSYIAGEVQNKNWLNQHSKERMRIRISESKEIFSSISSLLDRRIYRSRRLLYSFKDTERGIDTDPRMYFAEFNKILYDWNDSLNSNLVKIEIYFGRDVKKSFEDRVCADLRWIGILLRKYYFNMDGKPSLQIIEDAIDLTNERIYKMNRSMLDKIRVLEDSFNSPVNL